MPGYLPTLRPGLHGPEHRAALLAGGAFTRFGGPLCRRCESRTKAGAACQAVAVRGEDRCRMHLGRARLPRSPARIAANRQRAAWKLDPWAPGATLALSPDQAHALYVALVEAGQRPARMAPSVVDWLAWKWRRAWLDGVERPGVWTAALADLPGRVSAAGPRPEGWRALDPGETVPPAFAVPGQPAGRGSKRAKPTRARVELGGSPGQLFPPGPLPDLSRDDYLRAVMALSEHRAGALAVALATVESDPARLHLALAFALVGAGELDAWGWLDTLAALRGR